MMENTSINSNAMSNIALLSDIGRFIQGTRLQQNKTQEQTAIAAGINRSTLRQIEKGNGGTLLSLIQILRALDKLSILKNFEIDNQISPLLLARLAQNKRKRARNKGIDSPANFNPGW